MNETDALLISSLVINTLVLIDKIFSRIRKCKSSCCEIDSEEAKVNSKQQ